METKPLMKRLVFGEGLMKASLQGEKTFTVRKYREGAHDFVKGEVFIGEFKDGLDILLRARENTRIDTFKELQSPEKNVGQKGYWFDKHYFEELGSYYPGLAWEDKGAVIQFEVLEVEGVPAVKINGHSMR